MYINIYEKLLSDILSYAGYKQYFDNDDSAKSFKQISSELDAYRRLDKPVLIEDTSKEPNQILNIFALLDLIDSANSHIRIYTDRIKVETHGHSLVIRALNAWLVRSSYRKLDILIRDKQSKEEINDIFYNKFVETRWGTEKQIKIRTLKTNEGCGNFNCVVIDSYSYKIKLEDNKVIFAFSDGEHKFAKKMVYIFDKNFKSSKVILGENETPDFIKFLTLDWIDPWSSNLDKIKTNTKLQDLGVIIPDTRQMDTIERVAL